MQPLFDLMMQAQNGKALEAFSKQFGLAQEQATKAFAALTPAFSTGLKRNATNPYDFGSLLQSLTSGNYAKYFEDMTAAFSPQGVADGNNFLNTIFGSNDVTKAIAEQAAKASGVRQDMLMAMLPSMASAMAGGLVKEMTGQYQSMAEKLTANNPMMGMMTQWMDAAGFQPKPKKPEPIENPFLQMMQTMMGGAAQAPQAPQARQTAQAEPADPFGTNQFIKMMQSFMVPPQPAAKAKEEPKPAPAEAPSVPDEKAIDLSQYSELVSSMFDSGLNVQKSYQKSVESIFDGYVKSLGGGAAK